MTDSGPSYWIAEFREVINQLDESLSKWAAGGVDLDEACEVLVSLNRAKAELAMVYDSVSGVVSEAMADLPEIVLEDGAKVEKKFAAGRTGWQHKDLGQAVANRIVDLSVDMDTGEVLATPAEMISQVFEYVQPSYWRIKALQGIGINPDNFCEVGDTKASIIVRKGTSS